MRQVNQGEWDRAVRHGAAQVADDGVRWMLSLDRATGATVLEPVEVGEHCQGCDSPRQGVEPYLTTFHGGDREIVRYCPECADLARVDWTGEVLAVEGPLTSREA